MCGIIFGASRCPLNRFIHAAHLAQAHRGPDAGNVHFEMMNGLHLGFAHQRLSIVDLSELGRQPMESRSGKSLIIFNGEIYNHRDLATEFNLRSLRSASDTEVALELIEMIGMEAACQKFNGMWTIIFLNRSTGKVMLSRDRFGKKPLNYLVNEHGIFFASEVAALVSAPGFSFEVNTQSAAWFLAQSLQNVDESTWIKGVQSFPPGHIAELDLGNAAPSLKAMRPYWTPPLDGPQRQMSEADWIAELRDTVQDAVKIRLQADVPVGIALSGGIDSSIIAAVSREHLSGTGQGIGLFSAVNPGGKEDESEFIDIMEASLGQEVNKFNLDLDHDSGLFELLSHCNSHNDGPVASFSNVLFFKLMEKARDEEITVVLTGQGADEAFCGYRKYPFLHAKKLFKSGDVFQGIKSLSGFLLNDTILKDLTYAEMKRYVGKSNASILGDATKQAFKPFSLGSVISLADRQWQDISRFSVPYLCHYEDRMSMAASREVRAPFLDYRVIELGLTMPDALKLKGGWTKWALRQAFVEDLPKQITWRKDKKGFVNPQDKWLKSTLKDHVFQIMGDANHPIYTEGLVDRIAYLKMFKEYCEGSSSIWFRDVFGPFSLAVWMNEMKLKMTNASG
ncbi:asparagine synthase (glutamine-hydrolyzing) [uncultured Sulfitobacter sp.]|uniref:asparagine synthase (glutamine-hydrolyzing) n=1 Tax=uncultured Sulfitobacter sp. TaxID=191468 RepID=UPI0030D969FD|tara:strand:- start:54121 stop:55986 length:1866 start_codon:yes stop_codon:yes gene_type:complete